MIVKSEFQDKYRNFSIYQSLSDSVLGIFCNIFFNNEKYKE